MSIRGSAHSYGASTVVLSPEGWESELGLLADAGVEVVELCAEFGPNYGRPAAAGKHGVAGPLRRSGLGCEGRKSAKDANTKKTPGGLVVPTFDYTDPYAIERVARALREAGLRLHSIHGPIFLEAGMNESTSQRLNAVHYVDSLIRSLEACIDACAALGGRFVVTQDGLGEELPPESVERVPHLASPEPLSRLADYAARHGCVFAIENGSEDAARFSRLVETVARLDHPGLGICLDTGHAQVWNYRDVPRAVREAGGLLRTCHIHDNLGLSDDHLPPGDGVIPWGAVFEELGTAGYTGPLVLELHSDGGVRRSVEVADLLARSIEFLARFRR